MSVSEQTIFRICLEVNVFGYIEKWGSSSMQIICRLPNPLVPNDSDLLMQTQC